MSYEKERDEKAEEYRKGRCWPTKAEWIERKGDLDSRLSYEVGDYVEEAFMDGCDWANARAEKKVQGLVEAIKKPYQKYMD